jgi:hypothetical protein
LLTIFVNDFVVPDEATWRVHARSEHDPQIICRLDSATGRRMVRHGGAHPPHGKERSKSSEGRSAANRIQRINRW